jgi:opacity protein-like surface antigen
MKKIILTLSIALYALGSANAQGGIDFGVTGGLLNTNADINVSALGFNIANIDAVNKTGFYIGLLVDIEATEKLHIQPELTYGSAGDLAFIYLPVMAKYYVADGFFIQAGPQLNFSSNLGDIKSAIRDASQILGIGGDLDDILKSTAIDLGFGAGYDINENFMVQARYAIALTDRYDGPVGGALDVKNSTLQIGLTYFFK